MTPLQISKSGSESSHQKAFFAYCAFARNYGFHCADLWAEGLQWKHIAEEGIDGLQWIFHVPNGGARGDSKTSNQIRGANLKAEGVKDGVWDICWPMKNNNFNGLWIEMKKPTMKPKKAGSLGGFSKEQVEFGRFIHSQGYKVEACYSWQEAVEALKNYLKPVDLT